MTHYDESTVLSDLSDMERIFSEDVSGDRARAVLAYYGDVQATTEHLLSTSGPDDRRLLSQLIDAFRAAQAIVRQVWETQHGCVLVV